jgi:hypothetical protein
MRNELTLMELVDRYLSGELNAADRAAFEERMRTNAELREVVEDQRALHGGMERLALRPFVDKAYRSYTFGKWAPGFGIGGSFILLLAGVSLGPQHGTEAHQTAPHTEEEFHGIGAPATEEPMEADTMAEEANGSEAADSVRTTRSLVHTDTVMMLMTPDGRMVPVHPKDAGQLRKGSGSAVVITADTVLLPLDTPAKRTKLSVAPQDSLEKWLKGNKAPRLN